MTAKKTASSSKHIRQDMLFHVVTYCILGITLLIIAYPLYFIIIASFSNPMDVMLGKVKFYPVNITFEGFERIFAEAEIWRGYFNTIIYTVLQTVLTTLLTMMGAYTLSRRSLAGKKLLTIFLTIPMFFTGGLIPTFLWIQNMNLYNTIWALVLPGVSTYNLIIARTFLQNNIPEEMREATMIDGCSDARFFVSFIWPLSPAIIAVLALFAAVGMWNDYFTAMIYISDREKYPLQMFLREILMKSAVSEAEIMDDQVSFSKTLMISESMKYGVIIVSTLPMMILYPFLQKYFVQGVTIGSLKG